MGVNRGGNLCQGRARHLAHSHSLNLLDNDVLSSGPPLISPSRWDQASPAVLGPVADGPVSGPHNHLVRVVGVEEVEERARGSDGQKRIVEVLSFLKRAGQSALSDPIDKPPVRYSSVIVSPEADVNLITKFLCVTNLEMILLSARKSEPFFAISAVHVRVL
jgi:hypothetical protein